jgi:hypothetical protein
MMLLGEIPVYMKIPRMAASETSDITSKAFILRRGELPRLDLSTLSFVSV